MRAGWPVTQCLVGFEMFSAAALGTIYGIRFVVLVVTGYISL